MKIHLHAFRGLLKGTAEIPDNTPFDVPFWVPVTPPSFELFRGIEESERAIKTREGYKVAFVFKGHYANPLAWNRVNAEPVYELELPPWPR